MAAVEPLLDLARAGAARDSAQAELARKSLYYMSLMREVEDRIERKLYRQGKILGGCYTGRGQEAVSVGTGLATRSNDVLLPSHRDMALFFMRGAHPRTVFAQYMGRVGGFTRGRDGNMHMGDLNLKIVAIISSIGASVPVAAGVALGLKYQKSGDIAWVWFGDGATSRGDFHEGVNLAAVQRLPLVLVCNNNAYAYSTPLEKQMACANVADRGPGYGIPAEIVDGNDVLAVHEAAERAAAHCREGLGPYLIECKTFRMTGHSAHDAAEYVPKHLWSEWEKKDPIWRLEMRMVEKGWTTPEDIDALHAAIRRDLDEAVEWAEQSPYPDPSTLTDGVYGG